MKRNRFAVNEQCSKKVYDEISETLEKMFENLGKNNNQFPIKSSILKYTDVVYAHPSIKLLKELREQWIYFKSVGAENNFLNILRNIYTRTGPSWVFAYPTPNINIIKKLLSDLFSKNNDKYLDNCEFAYKYYFDFIKALRKNNLISQTLYRRIANSENKNNDEKTINEIVSNVEKFIGFIEYYSEDKIFEAMLLMKKIIKVLNNENIIANTKKRALRLTQKDIERMMLFAPFLNEKSINTLIDIYNIKFAKSKKTIYQRIRKFAWARSNFCTFLHFINKQQKKLQIIMDLKRVYEKIGFSNPVLLFMFRNIIIAAGGSPECNFKNGEILEYNHILYIFMTEYSTTSNFSKRISNTEFSKLDDSKISDNVYKILAEKGFARK